MNTIDINISSKALEKLVDVASKGCGILFEPTQIRRRAKAEADATLIKVGSEIRADELRAAAMALAEKRETRRIENISAILCAAEKELPKTVSEEPVEADWAAAFFNNCQDISNEQMQEIWAKILAGEIAQPGMFSLKTLESVKLIRKIEAELLTKACAFVLKIDHEIFIPSDYNLFSFYRKMGLTVKEFHVLEALGLLHTGGGVAFSFDENQSVLTYKNRQYKLYAGPKSHFYIWSLSVVGKELFPLCAFQENPEFLTNFFEILKKEKISFEEIM